jgi:hypothetical protein
VREPWSTATEPPPVGGPTANGAPDPGPERRITRRRTLPGGRAVLGALLVSLAVVGVVAAHLSATAAPRERYLVAAAELPAGTFLGDPAAVESAFRQVAVDLPPEVAARAVHVEAATSLVGRRLLAALAPGDLLLASGLAEAGADRGTSTFTFALPADQAVGGALTVGDHIDVVATTGSGRDATTAYVVRAAPVAALAATTGGLGGDGLRLTVELAAEADVQALAHALATANVVVVRSPGAAGALPAPYRLDPATGAGVRDEADPDGRDPDGAVPDGADPDGADPDGTDPDGTDPDDAGLDADRTDAPRSTDPAGAAPGTTPAP